MCSAAARSLGPPRPPPPPAKGQRGLLGMAVGTGPTVGLHRRCPLRASAGLGAGRGAAGRPRAGRRVRAAPSPSSSSSLGRPVLVTGSFSPSSVPPAFSCPPHHPRPQTRALLLGPCRPRVRATPSSPGGVLGWVGGSAGERAAPWAGAQPARSRADPGGPWAAVGPRLMWALSPLPPAGRRCGDQRRSPDPSEWGPGRGSGLWGCRGAWCGEGLAPKTRRESGHRIAPRCGGHSTRCLLRALCEWGHGGLLVPPPQARTGPR